MVSHFLGRGFLVCKVDLASQACSARASSGPEVGDPVGLLSQLLDHLYNRPVLWVARHRGTETILMKLTAPCPDYKVEMRHGYGERAQKNITLKLLFLKGLVPCHL